jgi:CheY-like chemotaxis protein
MPSVTKSVRLLVVEDEAFIRMDAVDFLRAAGFDVVEASSADEGILILERDPAIRLIFTDIDMPGSMNGLKFAAAVRERWPPIKIIAASGHFKLQAGDLPPHSRFFLKPYQPAQIIDAIVELTREIKGTPQ